VNDPSSTTQIFADQDVQDVLDATRTDVYNQSLTPQATFVNGSILYLDYFATRGDWEDGAVFKQALTLAVTPSLAEPIAGHWQFAVTTLPPVYITGKNYDVYRAAADLLERWSARVALNFDFTSDNQTFRRSQAATALQQLARTYRAKQRPVSISARRGDLNIGQTSGVGLDPTPFDYMDMGD